MSSGFFGGGAAVANGWVDDGTLVRLETATDHVAIGTATPALTGAGDLTIAGNTDLEGFLSIGNALPISTQDGVRIGKDFASAGSSTANQLAIGGDITMGNLGSFFGLSIGPSMSASNGAHTYSTIASLRALVPNIDNSLAATITNTVTVYIPGAATEGTNNYSVWIDDGPVLIDNTLQIGTPTAPVSDGDFSMSGNFDCEGYSSMGNANALDVDITLYLSRDFEVSSGDAQQLFIAGEIEVPLGNNNPQASVWIAPQLKLTTTGTTPWAASVIITEPSITQPGGGTVTFTTNLYLDSPATEGTNNYSLYCAGDVYFASDLILETGSNIVLAASGSKIGTATSQLLGFWDATPVAQHSATGETAGFGSGSGTGVNDDSTFNGNVGSIAYRISDIVKALKNSGIMAS